MTLENALYIANAHTTADRETLVGRSGSAYCVTTRDLDCLTPCALAFGWRAAKQELRPVRHSRMKCR